MKKSKKILQKQALSFGNWLLLHKHHDTPLGDLVADACNDPHFFPVDCTTKKMTELLDNRDCSTAAKNVLEGAIETYKKYKLAVSTNTILKEVYEDNLSYYGYICEKRAYTTD